MRGAWWVLVLCAFASGCGVVGRATCNLAYETRRHLDAAHENSRNRRWAHEAWAHSCGPVPRTADYAAGFTDGFLDYLEAGGSGEPPPLPPRRYWRYDYQTPQGRQAIEDWFAGFRHGARVAHDAGYRNLVMLPSSFGRAAHGPEAPPEPEAVPQRQPPDGEPLPPPRPVTQTGWGFVDVNLPGGLTLKWPARFQPVRP